MNAWMRSTCCAFGTVIAIGFGTVGTGCSSGSYTLRVQVSPIGVFIELTVTPLNKFNQLDLDGLHYKIFVYEGKTYRFYPSRGWIYDPETGQLYQLDDSSWQDLLDTLRVQHQQVDIQQYYEQCKEVKRQAFGVFTPNINACLGLLEEVVAIELSLKGDTPLPNLDERWPTLHRALFVFPDGVQGSPDPIRLELRGEPSDVFGYMAALGVTDGAMKIDGHDWTIVFNDDNWADVFIDETLFTSIPLH